ncbi:DUF6624 domain-containing protein [Ohtaekwangia sp.]|uniref:DUF6624 domain-containing protein n=1 Tax=Ohtaekwangia sp. TaxID=2066019 RepID=UPI002F95B757
MDKQHLLYEIALIGVDDKKYRFAIGKAMRLYGEDSSEVKTLWSQQKTLDAINQQKIETIIGEYGYPGKSLVGSKLQNVALFVIQHASLEMQEHYLPVIFEAAKNDELHKLPVLMLMDRIHLNKYGKQIFRSQSIWNEVKGKYEQAPIDETIDADSIRIALGLKPAIVN